MQTKATVQPTAKRVAVTVYMSQSLAERITTGYATALLNGYKGTKQAFITQMLESALTAAKEV